MLQTTDRQTTSHDNSRTLHCNGRLKMNVTCNCMNFTHLRYLMLLHYLVKVKTPKNITLQRGIAKENCIRCIIASPKWTRVIMCLKFTYRPIKLNLFMGVIQQSVHETKIHDIHNLRKCLMQTCFDFDRNIITSTPQIRSTILALYKLVCMYVCMYVCISLTLA